MTTKGKFMFVKDKKQSFDNSHADNANRYSNLSLNPSDKCSVVSPTQSYSKTYNDKNFATNKLSDSTISDNCKEKAKTRSFNKSSTISSSLKPLKNLTLYDETEEESKKRWKKDDSSNANSSTLSLHISAYENSVEATASDSCGDLDKFGSIENQENAKQIFNASSFVIQSSFEFPRQQSDKVVKPEVSKFRASQKLLSSAETSTKGKQASMSKEKEQQSSQSVFCPPSGTLHDVIPLTLAWHDIRVSRKNPSDVVILNNINGKAMPNEVVALMGASGAGKTTLLNSLMGRNLKGLNVTGDIIVGGSKNVKIVDVSGYVQQEEMFMPTLTVFEHLSIQAGIRLSGLSKQNINEKLTEIMEELELIKCRDSIIGLSGIKKGISGGEAKRLMVASCLLDNPSIIFLDEPTTGLDAHMAQSLMNSLKKLARDGRTIVCTIHQPSTSIFNSLDKVIFLADGQLAYLGPPKTILPFFDSLGLVCPDDYNPADYIIDMLAIDRTSGNEDVALKRIHKVCRGYTESPLTKDMNEELKKFEGFGAENGIPDNRRRASFLSQVWLILKRSLIDNRRNPALARAKIFQKIFQGFFVGGLYWNNQYKDFIDVQNANGALFYLLAEMTYSALFGVLTFMPSDFPLVVREYYDGLYSIPAYYIARILSYMPIFILDGALMMGISYYMVNFAPGFQYFLMNIGIGILIEQSSTAFGVMLSTICPSYAIALSITGPLLTVLTLTGGLYANVEKIAPYVRWVQWCSWFRYGFEALTINHWHGMNTHGEEGEDQTIGELDKTADEILKDYSFHQDNFGMDIGAMIGFIFLFYFIGYIGLHVRVRFSR